MRSAGVTQGSTLRLCGLAVGTSFLRTAEESGSAWRVAAVHRQSHAGWPDAPARTPALGQLALGQTRSATLSESLPFAGPLRSSL